MAYRLGSETTPGNVTVYYWPNTLMIKKLVCRFCDAVFEPQNPSRGREFADLFYRQHRHDFRSTCQEVLDGV